MTFTPTDAYDMMQAFVCEFKMIRAQTEGTVTWKRFPSDPRGFIESHPGRLKDAVESRAPPNLFREGATKERIPVKSNNKRISNKRPSTQIASSPTGTGAINQDLVQAMLSSIIQSRSPSTSPPPERRPQLQLENGGQEQKSQSNSLHYPHLTTSVSLVQTRSLCRESMSSSRRDPLHS